MNIRKLVQASAIILSVSASQLSSAAYFEKMDAVISPQSELQTFRSKIKESCQDCVEVERIVSRFLKQSCHIEETVSQSKDVMINSEMFAYLLSIKSMSVYNNAYSTILISAENTVDCEDHLNWYKKTKELAAFYLI